MSKWSVKLAAVLTAAGLLAGLTLPAWAAETSAVRQYETAQPVTSVAVDVENADLIIQKGTGTTVRVDSAADAKGEYTYDIDLKDGVLTVQVEAGAGEKFKAKGGVTVRKGTVSMDRFGNAERWYNQITVTLPDKAYDKIEAAGKNSKMAVMQVEAGEITLEGDNGSATLEGTRSRRTDIQLINGSIDFNQPYALDYDCEIRNGRIQGILAGTKADYRLEAWVRNGTCNLENQEGRGIASGAFQVTNGNIDLTFTG